ncbi:MAG: DUF1893 domain-containing protein [Vallitaleaceae bacterium]|jgi:hypothetical protein|nr:DUF1893 domain-containing protein [Vallitaleaceae bacterium]
MVEFQSTKEWFEAYPDKTCLIIKNNEVIETSTFKGVKPLLVFYQANGTSLEPLLVVDRIMGKGAIMLALLCGATKVMTPIISKPAILYAKRKGLEVVADKIVPYVINRTGDGRCPIESAVIQIDDLEVGYKAIIGAIEALMRKG